MSDSPKVKNDSYTGMAKSLKLLLLVIGLIILFISYYAFIFFLFAVLPSLTAIIIDRNSNKFASSIVCAFNLIGVMPYVFKLWNNGAVHETAKSFLTNLFCWGVIYGSTALGWLVIWGVPQLIAKIFITQANLRITILENDQKQLINEWGEEVKRNAFNIIEEKKIK